MVVVIFDIKVLYSFKYPAIRWELYKYMYYQLNDHSHFQRVFNVLNLSLSDFVAYSIGLAKKFV